MNERGATRYTLSVSRSRLSPCIACHRHIGAGESACPFCGAATPLETRRGQRRGTGVRAMAAPLGIALGAAAMVAACSGGPKEPPKDIYGGPRMMEGDDGAPQALEAADTAEDAADGDDAATPPAADTGTSGTDTGDAADDSDDPQQGTKQPRIYGGPRMRDGDRPTEAPETPDSPL